ncbi:MAG: hypothetical protein WC603_00535 [Candidatus Paceibacterota bacterium]|jgi:hypothetical protein
MTEQIKRFEDNVNEQQVIDALRDKGIDDVETKELLIKYIDQCHSEADREAVADPTLSNHANIKAEIKIAELYSKTQYKDYALESLSEIYQNAGQNESTKDLVEQIRQLIDELNH